MSMEDSDCKNIDRPLLKVNHADLERAGESRFKSVCPVCEEGTLMVRRNPPNMEISKYDNCVLCGQRFMYKDLGE